PLHALLFVGFQSEGSLGRRIQREAREITLTDRGQPLTLPIKLDIETIDGFSGHSDRLQLLNYVGTMEPRPERVIVNHGEEFSCSRDQGSKATSKCFPSASTLYPRVFPRPDRKVVAGAEISSSDIRTKEGREPLEP